jgi:uncharacterized protein YbbC (DUF1343 family)
MCGGVFVLVADPARFRPVATSLALVALASRMSPADFRFRTDPYEFVDDVPAFDLLTGDAEARELVSAGTRAEDVIRAVTTLRDGDGGIAEDAVRAAERRVSPLLD